MKRLLGFVSRFAQRFIVFIVKIRLPLYRLSTTLGVERGLSDEKNAKNFLFFQKTFFATRPAPFRFPFLNKESPMTASNNDRFGLSPEEYRRLIDAFKNATTPEERVQIFKSLLNDKMYAEFATVARRYKRETGALPDVETYSVVNKYVNDLLKWWYDAPEMILRFEELGNFIAYSRVALWQALLKKLQQGKGKGKGSELTGQENAPEPSVPDDFIAEIVGQDAFDELLRLIKEELTELELEVFLLRALESLSFPEIARLLSERSVPPKTFTADQVRAIYNRALKKIRRRLGDWGNGAFV